MTTEQPPVEARTQSPSLYRNRTPSRTRTTTKWETPYRYDPARSDHR